MGEDAQWRGVAGDYVVTLGPSSGVEQGSDDAQPTLSASVNAFTRMWLGVRPATGLAVTDNLGGPPHSWRRWTPHFGSPTLNPTGTFNALILSVKHL